MFSSKKQSCKIYQPLKILDDYNQETIEWEEIGTERIFIALNYHKMPAVNNSVFVQQCEWIGVADASSNIQIGYRVDDYEVVFIVEAGREKFLYLRKYGRNGDDGGYSEDRDQTEG